MDPDKIENYARAFVVEDSDFDTILKSNVSMFDFLAPTTYGSLMVFVNRPFSYLPTFFNYQDIALTMSHCFNNAMPLLCIFNLNFVIQ